MRALDPRLLSRTRSARPLLVTDVMLGIGTSVAVLLGATMLARIAAEAFHGAPLHTLAPSFAWLILAFAARAGCSRGRWRSRAGEPPGAVLSDLRLALVAKRLRTQPIAVDGAEGAEIATVSVQGVEALEGYFARYLPQTVLACSRPVAGDRVGRVRRPRGGRDHAAHASARAGVHVADRLLHGGHDAGALASAPPALEPFPRRRARPADAAIVRPRHGRGGGHRRGLQSATARRRWKPFGSASCRAPCSSWRRLSAWRWSRSRPASGSSAAASGCRRG